ncbi:unnamed protein product, partial [Phaeothamnion confervicola]
MRSAGGLPLVGEHHRFRVLLQPHRVHLLGAGQRLPLGRAGFAYFGLLQFLRTSNYPWHQAADFCSAAASGGHLDILQWLRAEGCRWDACSFSLATSSGHVQVLLWLASLSAAAAVATAAAAAEAP